MRTLTLTSLVLYAAFGACVQAGQPGNPAEHLVLPSQGLGVNLGTGVVTRNGYSDQCLEMVSRSSGNTLVVTRSPGSDRPKVFVNGKQRYPGGDQSSKARLGALRLSPDGSLVSLRSWKTGDKQTELLIDGEVHLTWKRGSHVRLLKVGRQSILLLVTGRKGGTRLVRHDFHPDGSVSGTGHTLRDFNTCTVERLRLAGTTALGQMTCGPDKGIFAFSLDDGKEPRLLLGYEDAEFVSLQKKAGSPKGTTVLIASGSPAALHFYYAVTGLLMNQTGEVRACMSDAEGLQSWNQSYRLRSQALLFEKTGASVFADLARKSMRLTLASQDRAQGSNQTCGWSSKIYAPDKPEGLKLMINQAVIANSLANACTSLGDNCSVALRSGIDETRQCLVEKFEPQFDPDLGLYRIGPDEAFRFAGAVAPWNWQLSFAALLDQLSDPTFRARSVDIVGKFQSEATSGEDGALWRYWPRASYLERGHSEQKIAEERFEDTGHAGISMLALAVFDGLLGREFVDGMRARASYVLSFGSNSPRDLDGKGPRAGRWFPAGGWAEFPSSAFQDVYESVVPSRTSSDAIFAYARLFDPEAKFHLTLTSHVCTEACVVGEEYSFSSPDAFLENNPFFRIEPSQKTDQTQHQQLPRTTQLKNQHQ